MTKASKRWFLLPSFLFFFIISPVAWYVDYQSPSVESLVRSQIIDRRSPRWPACDKAARVQTLTFLHVSDVHAHYNPDSGGSSPLAQIRGFYERIRQENPFTLLTDAGDDYEKGSIAEVLSKGRTTRQVVRAMGYDVRTIGNHDFAWGLEELLAFSRDPTSIVFASNIELAVGQTGLPPGLTDYRALTLGCVRVGFFGLVSKPWNEKGEQYNGSYFPELRADFQYVEKARKIIDRHRREVDLLVLVSHLGVYQDTRIAEQTEGIDLIHGGAQPYAPKAPSEGEGHLDSACGRQCGETGRGRGPGGALFGTDGMVDRRLDPTGPVGCLPGETGAGGRTRSQQSVPDRGDGYRPGPCEGVTPGLRLQGTPADQPQQEL